MPELPEVETIARALDRIVTGKMIARGRLLRARLAPDITPLAFARRLNGLSINFIHRRGKHILFDLTGDTTLIVHLRMSGRFSLLTSGNADPSFTHAVLYFDDETRLVFYDQRHFGLMKIVRTSEIGDTKELRKLAPEPFSDDFSLSYFAASLKMSKRSLKEFLLDQTRVCGLGNIYAAEAMFAAGVHPATTSCRVKRKNVGPLHAAIRDVLRIAISHAETLHTDPANLEGSYFSGSGESWMVYGRENEPCRICRTLIQRLKQGGRSTYFCKNCQRR
jgi:formamidopyrimidine-DNA glycosylase